MKTASITEAKNGLSALIDTVKKGQTVLIVDRKVPVARLEPVYAASNHEGRLSRLERQGQLRRGSGRKVSIIVKQAPPKLKNASDIVKTLIDERDDRI